MASLKVVKVEIEDQRGMPQISQTGQPHVFISASGGGRQLKIFYPAIQSNPWEWVVVIILGLVQGTQKIQSLCPPVNMALSDAVCPWILWAPRCRQQGMTHRAAEGSGRSTGQLRREEGWRGPRWAGAGVGVGKGKNLEE